MSAVASEAVEPPISTPAATPAPVAKPTSWDRPPFDVVLLCTVLALVTLSVVMVYSSSALMNRSDSLFFMKRQVIYAVIGLVAMTFTMRFDYRRLERWAYPLLFATGFLIILTFVPGIGLRAGNAQRWIRFPGFQFQPSEFAKIALLIYLAKSVAEKGTAVKDFKIGFVPHALVFGLFGAVVLRQPDFGSMVVMFLSMVTVLFVAGARLRYVFVAFIVAMPVAFILITGSAYRMRRIEAFLDPFRDPYGASYQVAQALTSVGSGGLFGLGLGEGREKLGFLPAGHTDYILASIGEELGLVGIALTLGLFGVLIWRGFRIALHASDAFGSYLAVGITSLFGIETVINAGMCLALLPSKGLALPFLSFGGTSILKAMMAAGLLLSVSSRTGVHGRPVAGAVRLA
jgi:cell division protein FtsW